MMNELSSKLKRNLVLLEEARIAIALFGGFSLVFLTIPVSNEPTILEMLSLFINTLSSALLLTCSLFLAITSTVEKTNLEPGVNMQHSLGELDPVGYRLLFTLTWISLGLFVISFILATFRIHCSAGIGGIFAILIIIFLSQFVTKKHDKKTRGH